MASSHERAWAEALAQEHAHQRELLATLRGELGAFAGECAAALTTLESFGVGLAELATAADTAKEGYEHVTLVLDVGRRLPGLATTPDGHAVVLYAALGDDVDVPNPLVLHAGELLRAAPPRSDRELLKAVVDAVGVRSRLEELIGPAPVAALAACKPLARWMPALATAGPADVRASAGRDLDSVLESTAALGEMVPAEATELAGSLRDTVERLRGAARAVEEGLLEQVLAEARRQLEGDLDRLRAAIEAAPDAAWQAVRQADHAALTEEVREKLERIERIRRALLALLPRLQLATRALATVEKVRAVENRLSPSAVAGGEAARLSLLLGLADLMEAILARPPAPAPAAAAAGRSRTRWLLAAAALVLAGAVLAVVLTLGGGSDEETNAAPTSPPPTIPEAGTTSTATTVPEATVPAAPVPEATVPETTVPEETVPEETVPPAPTVSPVEAVFDPAARATFYSVSVNPNAHEVPAYAWQLTPPKNDPSCTSFEQVAGTPNRAVWHHADSDGCTHVGLEHTGTITVTVTTTDWECTATFSGTLTKTGPPPQSCRRPNVVT